MMDNEWLEKVWISDAEYKILDIMRLGEALGDRPL